MNELLLNRPRKAYKAIDELLHVVERMILYIREDGGFSNTRQKQNVAHATHLLKEALRQKRSPSAGGLKPTIARNHPDWSALAWIDGRSEDLEEDIENLPYNEQQKIEERAILLLKEKKPMWSWENHHHRLFLRVNERKNLKKMFKELSKLPHSVVSSFNGYKQFKKGDLYGPKKKHKFSSRQKLLVSNESGIRKYGYVCYETNQFVTLIDRNGVPFKKMKTNVKEIERWRINY